MPGRGDDPRANPARNAWHGFCCIAARADCSGGQLTNFCKEYRSMSLFGAMSTAISGLNAQASAFSNISDNMANSQTIGFKEVDTNFIDYLTTSTTTQNQSGSVGSRPEYENELQGTIQQSANPLAMAISGQGFFSVSEQSGSTTAGLPIFDPQQYFTRAGDFTQNAQGYLVNSAGEYLNGWPVAANGTVNTSRVVPIQVAQTQYSPVPTANITLVANVPAAPGATSILSADTAVYDPAGDSHQLVTTWAQAVNAATGAVIPNQWTVTFSSPDNTTGASYTDSGTGAADPASFIGTADVTFNQNGTLGSVVADPNNPGALTASTSTTAGATNAYVQVGANFGNGAQNISVNLGTLNQANGLTQYAGTNYTVTSANQDGSAPGSFTGISATPQGAIVANYNNGRTVTIAQVPLITFQDADALQRQNGEAYTSTQNSGGPQTDALNSNGAGGLVVGSVESSNVDIASQLSQLIVAQQAYGANAKVITSANQLLTTTLDMKQ
jgi:flagellar hook protein FlgE